MVAVAPLCRSRILQGKFPQLPDHATLFGLHGGTGTQPLLLLGSSAGQASGLGVPTPLFLCLGGDWGIGGLQEAKGGRPVSLSPRHPSCPGPRLFLTRVIQSFFCPCLGGTHPHALFFESPGWFCILKFDLSRVWHGGKLTRVTHLLLDL